MVIYLAIYIWTNWLYGVVPRMNRSKGVRQMRTIYPKINRAKITAILLFAAFTVGCGTTNFSTFTDQKISEVSVCGAGLEENVRSDLYAAWTKAGGKLGYEFQETVKAVIFSSNSNDKLDMYNSYINCVLEIDRRNRKRGNTSMCLENCITDKSACLSRMDAKFRRCIADQMKGCYSDCRRRGFSRDRCLSDLCNWEEISKKGRNFYERNCKDKGTIIDLQSECDTENAECRRDCTE